MIYTVTFNPALDYVVRMEQFQLGQVNRTTSEEIQFGGKGINVSVLLKNIGVQNCALGFVAGFTGKALENQLQTMGVDTDFIHLPEGMTRINVKMKADCETEIDPVTGKKQSLSLINKRAEEGDWGEWADKLPSQFLSKQPKYLVDKQLNLAISDKMAEFDEICSLTNPTVKKSLLSSFADSCDYDAVHLQAAALPRQKYQVILPITSMKDNEVYAPNYKNGETVALVRYPHGGTFEIPIDPLDRSGPPLFAAAGRPGRLPL